MAAGLAAPAWGAGLPLRPILPGFHPDPSIVRVGDDFYLTNSTFEYFPGLPIYHSRDLVHWEQIGNALTRPSQLPLKGATDTGGLYAPTLRHWKGLFYLTCDNVSGGGNFIVTAKDPAGPWSEPMWMNDFDIDGSMFFDDDGKAYYTRHDGGEWGGIVQAEFDPATGKLTTPFKTIFRDPREPWNEGPHLYKIRGRYYLLLAEGGTGPEHMEMAARSDSPWGPFEICPHPVLTERDEPSSPVQCTGHGDLVQAPDLSWWMVFLGTRPQKGFTVLGRETFLAPVGWTPDGWPVVNGDHHVAEGMEAPRLKPFRAVEPPDKVPFTGNKLGPRWIHVRNADPGDFKLSGGKLGIRAARAPLGDKEQAPAFAGIRQPSIRVTVRVEMNFQPSRDGEEAGLCVRANDDNHYEAGLRRSGVRRELFVRNTVKGGAFTLALQPAPEGPVWLEGAALEDRYQFAWSSDGKDWHSLGASPAADLSREKAGGFTGVVLGLYASANGAESADRAEFSRFEMVPDRVPPPQALLSRPTPTPVPPSDNWRVNAGGGNWTGPRGGVWTKDEGFSKGETADTERPIQAARDGELYRTERWGADFSYAFPVPPGTYRVRLLFAETYVKHPGDRVFDAWVNDRKVLDHFDILREAGGMDRGVEKSFDGASPGPDGFIRVRFKSEVQNAKVCALEITPQK